MTNSAVLRASRAIFEIGAIFVSSSEMPPFGSAMLKMRISAFWGSRASEERRILRFLDSGKETGGGGGRCESLGCPLVV